MHDMLVTLPLQVHSFLTLVHCHLLTSRVWIFHCFRMVGWHRG